MLSETKNLDVKSSVLSQYLLLCKELILIQDYHLFRGSKGLNSSTFSHEIVVLWFWFFFH